jgi:disulfide bond formation protein DsbB
VPSQLTTARLLALLIPAALLGGAWTSQLVFGLPPCEMCHWQRWPHYAALLPALAAFFAASATQRPLIAVAALLMATSGAIGVFHAGVEYGWWEGLTTCAAPGAATLEDLLNAIFSLGGAAAIGLLLRRQRTAA